ncbi:MAG: hypothetical protein V3U24_07400 [Candidatus Neomarinimicrobiota bacterium]
MREYVVRLSWILGALFVLTGILAKLFGFDPVGVGYNINYFHATNTALLFGILFSLQKPR